MVSAHIHFGKSAAMRRVGHRQWSLKPLDLAVLFKLVLLRNLPRLPYAALASQMMLSAFEAHSSVQRLIAARLLVDMAGELKPVMPAVRDFVLHGASYCYPAVRGEVTIGFPTAYAVAPLREQMLFASDLPPVWPHPEGVERGATLMPLYEKLPLVAKNDPALYELLALFDALRMGQARERELATKLLEERL